MNVSVYFRENSYGVIITTKNVCRNTVSVYMYVCIYGTLYNTYTFVVLSLPVGGSIMLQTASILLFYMVMKRSAVSVCRTNKSFWLNRCLIYKIRT